MKIVNRCVLPANKIYDVVCYKCHSTVEYEGREGKYHAGSIARGPASYTFKCPVCEYSNTIDMTRGREPDSRQEYFDNRQV